MTVAEKQHTTPQKTRIVDPKENSSPSAEEEEKNEESSSGDEQSVVGITTLVVTPDEILLELYSGYADYTDEKHPVPVAKDTVFLTASVSKIITALTALNVYEKFLHPRGMTLRSDLSGFIPFQIHSPYPNLKLTFHDFLHHSSGIRDNDEVLDDAYTFEADDSMSLNDFLASYLTSTGPRSAEWNHPEDNFFPEGTDEDTYSNVGFQLLAFICEQITGEPFDSYSYKNILDPIGITRSGEYAGSWHLRCFDWQRHHALPEGGKVKVYTWPGYPDGGFRCTGRAMARIVQCILRKCVSEDGHRIISEHLADKWLNVNGINSSATGHGMGLGLQVLPEREQPESAHLGVPLIGHEGGEKGVSTSVQFYIGKRQAIGVVVLCNYGWPPQPAPGVTGIAVKALKKHLKPVEVDDDEKLPRERSRSVSPRKIHRSHSNSGCGRSHSCSSKSSRAASPLAS